MQSQTRYSWLTVQLITRLFSESGMAWPAPIVINFNCRPRLQRLRGEGIVTGTGSNAVTPPDTERVSTCRSKTSRKEDRFRSMRLVESCTGQQRRHIKTHLTATDNTVSSPMMGRMAPIVDAAAQWAMWQWIGTQASTGTTRRRIC